MTGNLFDHPPIAPGEETFTTLLAHPSFKMEQIISHKAASPEGFWYEQELTEWVMLVRGEADLRFEGSEVTLKAGDHLLIPAGRKHRVERTTTDAVWLALHFDGECLSTDER